MIIYAILSLICVIVLTAMRTYKNRKTLETQDIIFFAVCFALIVNILLHSYIIIIVSSISFIIWAVLCIKKEKNRDNVILSHLRS